MDRVSGCRSQFRFPNQSTCCIFQNDFTCFFHGVNVPILGTKAIVTTENWEEQGFREEARIYVSAVSANFSSKRFEFECDSSHGSLTLKHAPTIIETLPVIL